MNLVQISRSLRSFLFMRRSNPCRRARVRLSAVARPSEVAFSPAQSRSGRIEPLASSRRIWPRKTLLALLDQRSFSCLRTDTVGWPL